MTEGARRAAAVSALCFAPRASPRPPAPATRGFTLLELLVVLALLALVVGTVSLALRDPATTQLEREAERLSALLEAARAEARASALAVRWQPTPGAADHDFRFVGLPASVQLPQRWLQPGVQAQVVGAPVLMLGPEPIIGPQRVLLALGDRRVVLATDGLQPFVITGEDGGAP